MKIFHTKRERSNNVSAAEFKNLAKTAGEIAEAAEFGTGTLGSAIDWANLASASGTLAQATVDNGCFDYNAYEEGVGHTPAHNEYTNAIIDWSEVNWSLYDNGGTATCSQAMNNALEKAQEKLQSEAK